MAVQDLARIEEKLDKATAGAVAVSDHVGGIMFTNMAEVMEFSKLLSLAGTAVPKHLRGNPGGCLAVTIQALEWRMSPVAVANKSYEVNDRIAYESQLIHGVIEARAPLRQRLRGRYEGEGPTRCCIVTGHLTGEVEPVEYRSPTVEKIKVKNSPLWQSDPDQQLWYYASRAWSRRYCPDVLLGIYSEDELKDSEIGPEHARDITPKPDIATRLPGPKRKKQGFDGKHVETQIGNAKGKPDEVAQENVGPVKVQTSDAVLDVADEAVIPQPSEPLARGTRLLAGCKTPAEVKDLMETISDELTGTELDLWLSACEARLKQLQKAPA